MRMSEQVTALLGANSKDSAIRESLTVVMPLTLRGKIRLRSSKDRQSKDAVKVEG